MRCERVRQFTQPFFVFYFTSKGDHIGSPLQMTQKLIGVGEEGAGNRHML